MCARGIYLLIILKKQNFKANWNQRESGMKQNPHKLTENCSKQSQPQAGLEVLCNYPLTVSEDCVVVAMEQ